MSLFYYYLETETDFHIKQNSQSLSAVCKHSGHRAFLLGFVVDTFWQLEYSAQSLRNQCSQITPLNADTTQKKKST